MSEITLIEQENVRALDLNNDFDITIDRLGKSINSGLVGVRKMEGLNGFECLYGENTLPYLIKLVPLWLNADGVEASYSKYVELLGKKFVPQMVRAKIEESEVVKEIKKVYMNDVFTAYWKRRKKVDGVKFFDVFIQERIDTKGAVGFWEYVFEHSNEASSELSDRIAYFLDRMESAITDGWIFDISIPYEFKNKTYYDEKNANNVLITRDERIFFIDTEIIWNTSEDPRWEQQKELLLGTILAARKKIHPKSPF